MPSSHASDLFETASLLCTWAAWLWNTKPRRAKRLIDQAEELLKERAKHLTAKLRELAS